MRNFMKVAFVLFCTLTILVPSAVVQANKGVGGATAWISPLNDPKGPDVGPISEGGWCDFECSNGATGSGWSESASDCACDCARECGEHCEIESESGFILECDPQN